MSETLKGQIPALEEPDSFRTVDYAKKFIAVVIERELDSNAIIPIVGSLVGIELGLNPKLDIRTPTVDAFSILEEWVKGNAKYTIKAIQLHLETQEIEIKGPFGLGAVKLMDIDPKLEMCILAIDLSSSTVS